METDTRALKDIYAGMAKYETDAFKSRLARKGIGIASLYRWMNTGTAPHPANQKNMVDILKTMGYNVTARTLFPQLGK